MFGVGVLVVLEATDVLDVLEVSGVTVVLGVMDVLVVLVVSGVLVVASPELAFGSLPKMRSGMPRRVMLATVAAPTTQS